MLIEVIKLQKDLENLWFNYLIEIPIKRSAEEIAAINELSEKEKYFRTILNEEQLTAFTEYDNSLSKVSRISEKNAFIKGIMFATRFIYQALYG